MRLSVTAATRSDDVPRTVLMTSYFYSPIENPGTRRVRAFARYLPEVGYRPLVLTTDARGMLDDDVAAGVFRAPDLLRASLRLVPSVRRAQAARGPAAHVVRAGSWPARLLDIALVPDIHVGWTLPAVLRGLPLARSGAVDLLYSSSPPASTHLVALQLKRVTNLPWVADFRDGWMFEPPNPAPLRFRWRRPLERRLEAAVVAGADRIVTVNDAIAADFARRYPDAAGKIAVIPNGYDPEHFEGLHRAMDRGRFRLVHTGSISLSRQGTTITALLAALRLLRARRAAVLTDLEVVFVGALSSEERALIQMVGADAPVRICGHVSHLEALQWQCDADVLLLVTVGGETSVTTSKLFEYLAARRPILALTGRSPAAKLINELGVGVVVAPDDAVSIAAALERYHIEWLAGGPEDLPEGRALRFDRRRLTGRLATLLDELIAPR
jgi:glycosyltransferase involved in cell wall biosynthesis